MSYQGQARKKEYITMPEALKKAGYKTLLSESCLILFIRFEMLFEKCIFETQRLLYL